MKKISTLFKKDPSDLSRVINEINPENAWVFQDADKVTATRKFDGTACAIINGELYKRYDVKKGRDVPRGAIACQEPDEITGHWPHWIKCDSGNPADRFHIEGFTNLNVETESIDGTYELCGPKVQGNPEKLETHELILHGSVEISISDTGAPLEVEGSFEYLKWVLTGMDIEGIVFHHQDGRMCKIRKSDFGIKRQKA